MIARIGNFLGMVVGYAMLLAAVIVMAFALASPALIGLAAFVYLTNAVFG